MRFMKIDARGIKSLADYQDDGESDTDHENSDFQWKERPIAYRKLPAKQMMYRSKRVVATILDSQTNFATIALAPTPRATRIRIT